MDIEKEQLEKARDAFLGAYWDATKGFSDIDAGLLAAAPFLQERTPAEQPSGDVVTMTLQDAYQRGVEHGLSEAREGYVLLEDVEKAITDAIVTRKGDVLLAMEIVEGVRSRLQAALEEKKRVMR